MSSLAGRWGWTSGRTGRSRCVCQGAPRLLFLVPPERGLVNASGRVWGASQDQGCPLPSLVCETIPPRHPPLLVRSAPLHRCPTLSLRAGASAHQGACPLCSIAQVPNPEFEGQTKTRLGNPEVRKVVEGVVGAGARFVYYLPLAH